MSELTPKGEPLSLIEINIRWIEEQPPNSRDAFCSAQTLKLLTDLKNPDVAILIDWLKKHSVHEVMLSPVPDTEGAKEGDYCPLPDPWEWQILFLAEHWDKPVELADWERVGARERRSHAMRVARLARELADAIEDPRCVPVTPIDVHIDADIRREYLEEIWDDDQTRPEARRRFQPGFLEHKVAMNHYFGISTGLRNQRWESMLRSFSSTVTKLSNTPGRDARPATGAPHARVFARYLADSFFRPTFKRTPNEVIAACVRLKFPDLLPIPDEGTIRGWRGVK